MVKAMFERASRMRSLAEVALPKRKGGEHPADQLEHEQKNSSSRSSRKTRKGCNITSQEQGIAS
jgi:hypothetical protein